jgi:hypothetical protein
MELFGAIVLEATCPQCSGPIPLNGPVRFPTCARCRQVIALGPRIWQSVLGKLAARASGVVAVGSLRLSMLSSWQPPHCTACVAEVPLERARVDGTSYCVACGRPFDAFPPPTWLAEVAPQALCIIGADRERPGEPAPASPRRWFVGVAPRCRPTPSST